MIQIAISLFALAHVSAQTPQAAYEQYLARFEKSPGITGSTFRNFMDQPKTSVFRLIPGGKRLLHGANTVEYCDGQKVFTYSPDENKYLVGDPVGEMYGILFGPRFAPPGAPSNKAIAFEEKEEAGRVTRVFTVQIYNQPSPAVRISVRKDTGLPISITFPGQQGSWTIELQELHVNRPIRPETITWSFPPGAQRSSSIKG